jgi:Restriction endonuclease fold toxin 7
LQATIPDVYAGGQAPIADIKDLLKISDTPQLQAQAEVAKATGTSFSVITGPRNLQISQPIADVVQNSGGFIFRVDPLTSTVEVWDSASRFWVPFLGGNW